MEEKQKEEPTGSNKEASQGFDFNKLLDHPAISEFIKHLISGGGALAGNYFAWIKPMQEKIEAMNKLIEKQNEKIKELEQDQDALIELLQKDKERTKDTLEGSGSAGNEVDYFSIKKKRGESDRRNLINRLRKVYL